MIEEVSMRMDEAPVETGPVGDIAYVVEFHAQCLVDRMEAFGNVVNEGLARLRYEPDAYFDGAADRLEAELEGMLDSYDEVRRLTARVEAFEGWNLLVEIHEETLAMVQDWLEEIVELVDDPEAAASRTGRS